MGGFRDLEVLYGKKWYQVDVLSGEKLLEGESHLMLGLRDTELNRRKID